MVISCSDCSQFTLRCPCRCRLTLRDRRGADTRNINRLGGRYARRDNEVGVEWVDVVVHPIDDIHNLISGAIGFAGPRSRSTYDRDFRAEEGDGRDGEIACDEWQAASRISTSSTARAHQHCGQASAAPGRELDGASYDHVRAGCRAGSYLAQRSSLLHRPSGSAGADVTAHAVAIEGPIPECYVVAGRDTPDESKWRTEFGRPILRVASMT